MKLPTRGANTLDQIFTNITEYYSPPSSLPPLGLSDHLTLSLSPSSRIDAPSMPKCKTNKTRIKKAEQNSSRGQVLSSRSLVTFFLPVMRKKFWHLYKDIKFRSRHYYACAFSKGPRNRSPMVEQPFEGSYSPPPKILCLWKHRNLQIASEQSES